MEMTNLGSITKLLAILITNAIDDSMDAYRQNHSEDCPNNNDNRHSRIVKGEYVTMNPSSGGIHRGQLSTGQSSPNHTPPNQSSPFSNIFCETNPQRNSADENIKSNISFDEAFLDESITMEETTEMPYDDTEEAEPTMSWTRQRIKHFNSSIDELNPSGAQSDKISFTKDQLASAEVIAQVDSSFITVKMGSLLCLVDQHAADERVSLETLEEAFTRHDSHDGMKISLTKRDIHLGDIFKSCPVAPSIKVHLTMTQTTAARHYHSLLHKWKFSFEESKTEERTIMLRGLPSVCGRVAQVADMLEFLNDLGSLAGGSSIKPKFVSSVLASNACRYATMFGESMSLQQCQNLIEALAKCQLPFVCAHGRPSIIPLIDMAQKSTKQTDVVNITKDIARNRLETYQRWGSKRVLNRKRC
jgi:DNA mismatch repair ATPase MutL